MTDSASMLPRHIPTLNYHGFKAQPMGVTMSEQTSTSARTINALTSFLTAADRATADPTGAISQLRNLVAQWLQPSTEATTLFTRLQQDPSNGDLQSAVCGRLAEVALVDTAITDQMESILRELEADTLGTSTNQPSQQFDVRLQGTMQGSVIQQGNGTIDQSKKKILKVSFPVAGLPKRVSLSISLRRSLA